MQRSSIARFIAYLLVLWFQLLAAVTESLGAVFLIEVASIRLALKHIALCPRTLFFVDLCAAERAELDDSFTHPTVLGAIQALLLLVLPVHSLGVLFKLE